MKKNRIKTDKQWAEDAGLTLEEYIQAMQEAQKHYAASLQKTINILDDRIKNTKAQIDKLEGIDYEG